MRPMPPQSASFARASGVRSFGEKDWYSVNSEPKLLRRIDHFGACCAAARQTTLWPRDSALYPLSIPYAALHTSGVQTSYGLRPRRGSVLTNSGRADTQPDLMEQAVSVGLRGYAAVPAFAVPRFFARPRQSIDQAMKSWLKGKPYQQICRQIPSSLVISDGLARLRSTHSSGVKLCSRLCSYMELCTSLANGEKCRAIPDVQTRAGKLYPTLPAPALELAIDRLARRANVVRKFRLIVQDFAAVTFQEKEARQSLAELH